MDSLLNKIKQNKFATVVTIILVLIVGFTVFNTDFLSVGNSTSEYGIMRNKYSNSPSLTMPYGGATGVATQDQISQSEKKIIKNGSLSLLTKKVDEASKSIEQIAESNGGSIDEIDIYNVTNDTKAGTITVRVPNNSFDKTIDAIKKIAVKVEREEISTDDVTAQFVDLEARLTNYRAVEKQYQSILTSAKTVDDTLAVYAKLAEVRGNIESVQGQINYLSRQIDMSIITVRLTAEADVQVFGIVWRPLTVLKQAFRDFLSDMTSIVDSAIVLIFWLPGFLIKLLFWVIILIIVWKIFKVLRRRYWSKV